MRTTLPSGNRARISSSPPIASITLARVPTYISARPSMVQYKKILEQNDVDDKGRPTRKWIFRHDKIRDYFLMQAIVNKQDERLMLQILTFFFLSASASQRTLPPPCSQVLTFFLLSVSASLR